MATTRDARSTQFIVLRSTVSKVDRIGFLHVPCIATVLRSWIEALRLPRLNVVIHSIEIAMRAAHALLVLVLVRKTRIDGQHGLWIVIKRMSYIRKSLCISDHIHLPREGSKSLKSAIIIGSE